MDLTDINTGDFVKGQYKYGCISGVVVSVKRNVVVIDKCDGNYNEYTPTGFLVNLTKTRIDQVGLNENEILKL